MAADIPAGLGYLALGLGFAALDVVVIRNRSRIARTARLFSTSGVFMLSLIALMMVGAAVSEFRG